MSRFQNDVIYMPTQWEQCDFQSVKKTNEEDEHPVVSEGECKQLKVMKVTAKMRGESEGVY